MGNGWFMAKSSRRTQKGKVVVVDFYETWCGPCMAASPHNNELLKKYKGQRSDDCPRLPESRGRRPMQQHAKEKESNIL